MMSRLVLLVEPDVAVTACSAIRALSLQRAKEVGNPVGGTSEIEILRVAGPRVP